MPVAGSAEESAGRGRLPRRLLFLALALGLGWLGWIARPVFAPFLLAVVTAYLLAPLVEFVTRRGMPRSLAILLIYALLGAAVVGLGLYLIPLMVQESVGLIRRLPTWTRDLQGFWSLWLTRLHEAPLPPSLRQSLNQTARHLESHLFSLLKSVLKALFGLVPGVLSILVAPILAFFILKDLDRIRRHFWALIPVEWRPAVFKLGLDVDRSLSGFIRGQLMVALFVGMMATLWTALLRVPFAPLIGALAAVTDVVPYIGPIVGAIPAVILAFVTSPWKALYVILGFVVIHQLEGSVVGPKVMGESVGLNPLVVIFSLLVGGEVAGLAGLLLAVPAAAVVKVMVVHLYRRLTEPEARRPRHDVRIWRP